MRRLTASFLDRARACRRGHHLRESSAPSREKGHLPCIQASTHSAFRPDPKRISSPLPIPAHVDAAHTCTCTYRVGYASPFFCAASVHHPSAHPHIHNLQMYSIPNVHASCLLSAVSVLCRDDRCHPTDGGTCTPAASLPASRPHVPALCPVP